MKKEPTKADLYKMLEIQRMTIGNLVSKIAELESELKVHDKYYHLVQEYFKTK